MEEDLIHFASNEIINYMQARPGSADTVEGIHQVWIQWPNTPETTKVTLAALEQLERDGFMEKVQAGPNSIWRHKE